MWSRGSSGSTLVEVVAAVAVLTVLAGVGMSIVRSALRAVSAALEDARWNTTVLLFERAVRGGIDAFPAAFWEPPPRLLREGSEVRIVSNEEDALTAVRFSQKGGLLTLTTRTQTILLHDIASCSVEVARASDGREGGIRVELAGRRRSQAFLVAWRGQRL